MRHARNVLAASVLALAVSQASAAVYTIKPVETPSAPFTGQWTLSFTNQNDVAVGTENVVATGAGQGVVTWMSIPGQPSVLHVGLMPADGDYQSPASATAGNSLLGQNGGGLSANGTLMGFSSRTINSPAESLGTDAWIFKPGSTAGTTFGSTFVYTPTVITPNTTTSTDGMVTSYFYTTASNHISRTANSFQSSAANDNGWAMGSVLRSTGLDSTHTNYNSGSLGNDIYVYNGTSTIAVGLGVNTSASAAATFGNFYQNNVPQTALSLANTYIRTNFSITNGKLPGDSGMNANNVVVGYSQRYQSLTVSSPCGQDMWLYNFNNSGTTSQIGLIGTASPVTLTVNGGTVVTKTFEYKGANTYTTRSSAASQLNAAGQVAGTTSTYTNSTNPVGSVSWIYTPSATPGTDTSFGGAYTQVGLISNVAGPATSSNIGYTSSTGAQTTAILALTDNGKAAGTSSRYVNTATTQMGTDSWYFNGSATTPISPTSIASANLSYYSGGTAITSTTAATYSNYYSSSATAFSVNTGISAMTSSGSYIAGTINRYLPGTTTQEGNDVWIYNTATGTETVLINPGNISTAGNFPITVSTISADGTIAGTYTTYSTGTTQSALYIYEWSPTAGFTTIQQTQGTSSTFLGVNNALSGQTSNWPGYVNASSLYLSDSNTLYGNGVQNAIISTPTAGAWEITVPEPTSLAILAMGAVGLLNRRRRAK